MVFQFGNLWQRTVNHDAAWTYYRYYYRKYMSAPTKWTTHFSVTWILTERMPQLPAWHIATFLPVYLDRLRALSFCMVRGRS